MVPAMCVGACIGRVFGFSFSLLQDRVGDVGFFAECAGHDQCITPGVYAIIGSAAMLSAVSRMTVSLVVIIFELTGVFLSLSETAQFAQCALCAQSSWTL